jgi:PAS domain S-box-containing protein
MTEGVSISDESGRIVFTNAAEDAMFGYSAGELVGKHVSVQNAYPDEENQRIVAEVMRCLKQEGYWEGEWLNRRKDGSEFVSASRISAIRINGAAHWLCVQRDITDAKSTSDRLLESESRLAAIFEQAPAGLSELDCDGTFLKVNEALCRLLGRTSEELIGTSIADVTHPEDFEQNEAFLLQMAATGEPFSIEKRYIRPDGTQVWARSSVSRIVDAGGVPVSLLAATVDINDQKRAEAALRQASEKFAKDAAEREAILSQLDEGVIVTDVSGQITFVNEAAERLHGVKMLGVQPEGYSETYHLFTEAGEPYPSSQLPLARAALAGEAVPESRWRIVRPDGTTVVAIGAARPVYDENATRFAAVLTLRDDTERSRAEQHQRLLINELNHRVKNTLAIVQSLARQSLREEQGLSAAKTAFEARLAALSRAHDVLTRENWEAAPLEHMVHEMTAPYRRSPNPFRIAGPQVLLRPETSVALSLALHELATNAAKYGALTVPEGQVEISWRVEQGRLKLLWREENGPKVKPPTRRGFGTRLIERALAAQLQAVVSLLFLEDGLQCTIDAQDPASATP